MRFQENNVKRRLERRMGLLSLCALLGQYPIARRSSRRKQSFHTDSLPTMLVFSIIRSTMHWQKPGPARSKPVSQSFQSRCRTGANRAINATSETDFATTFHHRRRSTFVESRPRNFGRDFITSVYDAACT